MTHYELLGISPEATREEIKQAYRKRALETHPDLRRGRPAEIKQASSKFVRISKAYATLIDPQERIKYDDTLNPPMVTAAAGPIAADREGRITPPTPPAPTEPARVREDLQEIDGLRRQIWEEPREVVVRHLILYLVFLAVLPFGIYALIQEATSRQLGLRMLLLIPISCGLGVRVFYGVWVRFLRIRASGGFMAFWVDDRRRRRQSRRRSSAGGLFLMLWYMLLLLALVGVSIMLIMDHGVAEPSILSASIFVLAASLVALVVLFWRAFSRR